MSYLWGDSNIIIFFWIFVSTSFILQRAGNLFYGPQSCLHLKWMSKCMKTHSFEVMRARQFHWGLTCVERGNHTSYLASHKPKPSRFRLNVLPCIQSIFVPCWHADEFDWEKGVCCVTIGSGPFWCLRKHWSWNLLMLAESGPGEHLMNFFNNIHRFSWKNINCLKSKTF